MYYLYENVQNMTSENRVNYSRLLNFLSIGFSSLVSFFATVPAHAELKFLDPINTAARIRSDVERRPMMAVARAGDRLVAVGSRGLIIWSDDQGVTWVQAKVPVQSDLLAIHFPTNLDGWAVGHDGVVLHSADAGKTWSKQLDGLIAAEAFKKIYSAMGPMGKEALGQLMQNYKAGPALPFLDVWFEDKQIGFAVGSFGMLITTTDGGKSWEPALHRVANEQSLNLNAVRGLGNDLYIVGERGKIYQLDRDSGRFIAEDTGYLGSFFGVIGNSNVLIAFGLRGTTYRCNKTKLRTGRGNNCWEPVSIPTEQTITAGVTDRDGNFVLVDAAGQFILLDKEAKDARLLPMEHPMRTTGIVLDRSTYIVTGLEGVRTETIRNSFR